MKKYWKTKEFKELEHEWYQKLEQEGFSDAEKPTRHGRTLRQHASNAFRGASQVARENKQRYYELLSKGFHQEEFEDQVEELVIQRRSEGVKIKEICLELQAMNERCHRQTVRLIIQAYEKKWGIKQR